MQQVVPTRVREPQVPPRASLPRMACTRPPCKLRSLKLQTVDKGKRPQVPAPRSMKWQVTANCKGVLQQSQGEAMPLLHEPATATPSLLRWCTQKARKWWPQRLVWTFTRSQNIARMGKWSASKLWTGLDMGHGRDSCQKGATQIRAHPRGNVSNENWCCLSSQIGLRWCSRPQRNVPPKTKNLKDPPSCIGAPKELTRPHDIGSIICGPSWRTHGETQKKTGQNTSGIYERCHSADGPRSISERNRECLAPSLWLHEWGPFQQTYPSFQNGSRGWMLAHDRKTRHKVEFCACVAFQTRHANPHRCPQGTANGLEREPSLLLCHNRNSGQHSTNLDCHGQHVPHANPSNGTLHGAHSPSKTPKGPRGRTTDVHRLRGRVSSSGSEDPGRHRPRPSRQSNPAHCLRRIPQPSGHRFSWRKRPNIWKEIGQKGRTLGHAQGDPGLLAPRCCPHQPIATTTRPGSCWESFCRVKEKTNCPEEFPLACR